VNKDEDERGGVGLAKSNGELFSLLESATAVVVTVVELSLVAADGKKVTEDDGNVPFWLGSDGFVDVKEDKDLAKGLGFVAEVSDGAAAKLPSEKIEED
jgi:hypothetical protein